MPVMSIFPCMVDLHQLDLILQVIDLYLSMSVPKTRRPGLQQGHIALFDSLAQGGQRHQTYYCAVLFLFFFFCMSSGYCVKDVYVMCTTQMCSQLAVYSCVSLDVQERKLNFI